MKQKLLMCLFMILCVCFGFSRETRKFGFFFKVDESNNVGLTINLLNRVTLRPSFGFGKYKDGPGFRQDWDVKSHTYSVDLGLFYHFLKKDHITAYSGFEVGYSYLKWENELPAAGGIIIDDPPLEIWETRGHRGNVIFGLQYNFNKRLAVFGEIAYGFWKEKNEKSGVEGIPIPGILYPPFESNIWSFGRSGLGIILYL